MATSSLNVEIITPERKLEPIQADHVNLPAFDGEVGIRPGHMAFVCLLGEGTLQIKSNTEASHEYALKGGVAQIHENTIYILAESVVAISDIGEADLLTRFNELKNASYTDDLEKTKAKAEAHWISTQLKSAGKTAPSWD